MEGRIKSGSFAQDARGRRNCNLAVEYEPKPHGKNAEVGIELGLKEARTLSTGVKAENHERKVGGRCQDGMSRNMLRYKAISRAATFVDTPEHLSTQACSACGCIGGPKGTKGLEILEIREWTCDDCGAVHDRDVNAARNILRLGRQALAEESSIHTR
jgi:Zn-finger protein